MQKFKKKYAPYILILIMLVGLFSPATQVSAQIPQGTSSMMGGTPVVTPTPTPATTPKTAFESEISNTCGLGIPGSSGSLIPGCMVYFFYYLYYVIPSFLLFLTAYIFNFFISITLYSTLYFNNFIPEAWAVVRDLSNIFFILILLYIAIKTILGLGGHEVKKMIIQVIIVALLINFSMFFTKVVIDSSNILALIFYNKVSVETSTSGTRPYNAILGEKDVSGGLVSAFNPTKLLDEKFFEDIKYRKEKIGGKEVVVGDGTVPAGTMLSLILISGSVMCFAIYALFISGISFLGRLIELWILIIFSPFALMSSTVPKLAGIEYLGWSAWFKRLISTSFMAPIFMFFLYLIFKLVHANIFGGITGQAKQSGMIGTLLSVIIPAMIILAILLKATEYAKKGGGKFGELMISAAKLTAGLAVGGAALGAAAVGRGTAGAVAKSVQSSSATRRNAFTFKDTKDKWNKGGLINKARAIGSLNEGVGKAAVAGVAELIHKAPSFTKDATGAPVKLGAYMQAQDKGYGEKTHATHVLDQKMQQEFGNTYGKDAKYKDLMEHEQAIVKKEVDKDEMAKFRYGKQFKDIEAQEAGNIMTDYNAGIRVVKDENTGIKTEANITTGIPAGKKVMSDVIVEHSKTSAVIGEFVQALRKGTYDIRNLPDMSPKSKGILPAGVGTIALVAAGVRLGLKKAGGVEYGTPQRNYVKDFKNTITEALKNVKINFSTGGGGGGHGGESGHTKEVKSVGH